MNREFYDIVEGGINGDDINNDKSFTDAITINSPLSTHDFRILGIQVRFPTGAEDALIKISDSDKNQLIGGNVQLSQMGNRSQADILRDEFPVDMLLRVGTTLVISIKPATGKSIAKDTLNVTLFGKKVPVK